MSPENLAPRASHSEDGSLTRHAYNRRMLQTISWTGSAVRLLDQTKLPTETVYVDITDEKQMWDAIKRLVVRGAPAIGVAAAFGVYLGVRDFPDEPDDSSASRRRLDEVCDYLTTSRPTAVNLFWAIDRVRRHARVSPTTARRPANSSASSSSASSTKPLKMLDEDTAVCRAHRRARRRSSSKPSPACPTPAPSNAPHPLQRRRPGHRAIRHRPRPDLRRGRARA